MTALDLRVTFEQHRLVIRIFLLTFVTISAAAFAADKQLSIHSFTKTQITDKFWSEGSAAADVNCDGKVDLIYGPFWYAGPNFTNRFEYRPTTTTFTRKNADGSTETIAGFEGSLGVNNAYSDCFLMFAYDFNHDHWPDILVIGFPGLETYWYENPKNQSGHWQKHLVLSVVDNESPGFSDVTGDGKPELICCSGGYIGYAEANWKNPYAPWKFHAVSPKGEYQRFTHGLGVGDVNGDGRQDLLEKDGWWEQPKKPGDDRPWRKHPYDFGSGGAQMFAYDVNGDGLNNVITSLEAHGRGIVWFEQIRTNGQIEFHQHLIVGKTAKDNRFGVEFSQPHALELVDMDGDGLKDLVTGKRFWAHGAHGDPDPNSPAVLYWFQLQRDGKGGAEFIPHLVDENSGVGTQVSVAHVSSKKHPDIIVGNKKGLFLFRHETKKVSAGEWKAAQPKPVAP